MKQDGAGRLSVPTPGAVRTFLQLRMIVAALVVGAGIMILQLTREGIPVRPLYLLLLASYLSGGLAYLLLIKGMPCRLVVWGTLLTDLLLETGIIHFSGGIASQFSLVFCLTIVAAAFTLQMRGGMMTAALASILYLAYGIVGVLRSSSVASFVSSTPGFLQVYMHVSLFFLVGAMGGYLAQRMVVKGSLLEQAETRLKQLKVDTDNILRNMSSGVLVVGSDGRILTINPAAEDILGISASKVLAQNLEEGLAKDYPELAMEILSALRAERSKFRHEITLRKGRTRKIPLGISLSLLRDDGGRKRGVIAVFQDLTEVREMQERIRKADRLAAIGELSAAIAHEIRNPLASISGSIEMLANELKLRGENKRLMELVMKESDRLDRIIGDFLEYARMRPPSLQLVELRKVVQEVLTLVIKSRHVGGSLETRVEDRCSDVLVQADEEQLKQVFFNLAINAYEAMGGSGVLEVALGTSPGWVTVSFRDQGPGVGAEERNRLFEPFFTTKEGGTGLGLAIANKIIEAHGGRITYQNRSEGGAEFIVFLPGGEKCADKKELEAEIIHGGCC